MLSHCLHVCSINAFQCMLCIPVCTCPAVCVVICLLVSIHNSVRVCMLKLNSGVDWHTDPYKTGKYLRYTRTRTHTHTFDTKAYNFSYFTEYLLHPAFSMFLDAVSSEISRFLECISQTPDVLYSDELSGVNSKSRR